MLFIHVVTSLSCYALFIKCCNGAKLRIIGGQEALNRYEFMVSLQTFKEQKNILGMGTGEYKNFHRCGGSIVTHDCIVTAGHCVYGNETSPFTILVGSNNLDDPTAERHNVSKIVVHPQYKGLAEHDIAFLRLRKPLIFSTRIGPITLSKDYIRGGVALRLIGWGYTDVTKLHSLPRKLQELNTESITQEECNKNLLYKPTATDICTRETGNGASNGDSGGPLILYRDAISVLVGIVSRGFIISAFFTMPDIFARASEHVDYIIEQCNKPLE